MKVKGFFVALIVSSLSNGCTKLKNQILPLSYQCGSSAKDWSHSFLKVYNAEGRELNGVNLFADLDGIKLPVSEKGCVQIPDKSKSGVLIVRDVRPSIQEGKILRIENFEFPSQIDLETVSSLVPIINCLDGISIVNSTQLDVPVSGDFTGQTERFTFQAFLKDASRELNLKSNLEPNSLRVDIAGNDLADGLVEFEIVGTDKLRSEKKILKTCKVNLDRNGPISVIKFPGDIVKGTDLSLLEEGKKFYTVRPDDRIEISSEEGARTFVSVNKFNSEVTDCSAPYIQVEAFETPKNSRWKLCFYSQDQAGNRSSVNTAYIEVNEDTRRILIEKLVDNAKLNAERFRYEAASEAILQANSEWQSLALERDRQNLLPLLKSGYYEVLNKSYLVDRFPIETYRGAIALDKGRFFVLREKDAAIYSPDGKLEFSGVSDLDFIEASVTSGNLQKLAISDQKGRLVVVNASGKVLLNVTGRPDEVFQQAILSHNGDLLAAGSVFGNLYLWNVKTGEQTAKWELGSRIKGLAFGKDENTLLASTKDGAIWSVKSTGKGSLEKLVTTEFEPEGIALLNNDTLLIRSVEALSTLTISKHTLSEIVEPKPGIIIEECQIDNEGKALAVRYDDGTLNVLSVETFEKIELADLSQLKPTKISFYDSYLAMVDKTGMAKIIDIKTSSSTSFRIAEGEEVLGLMLKDGNLFSTTATGFAKWSLKSKFFESKISLNSGSQGDLEVSDLYLSVDNVAVASHDGRIVSSQNGNSRAQKIDAVSEYSYIYFGDKLFARLNDEKIVFSKINEPNGQVSSFDFSESINPEFFRWNEVDRSFFISSEENIYLFSTIGKVLESYNLKGFSQDAGLVANSLDGSYLITGGDRRGSISIWNRKMISNGPREVLGHSLKVNNLEILGKSNFLSSSDDGTLSLWDFNGKLLRSVTAHASEVRSLAIIPDDNEVFSTSSDGILRVWDKNLNSLANIQLPGPGVRLKLRADGQFLAIVIDQQSVVTIPVDLALLKAKVCEIYSFAHESGESIYCKPIK